jgi:hypothetical protein
MLGTVKIDAPPTRVSAESGLHLEQSVFPSTPYRAARGGVATRRPVADEGKAVQTEDVIVRFADDTSVPLILRVPTMQDTHSAAPPPSLDNIISAIGLVPPKLRRQVRTISILGSPVATQRFIPAWPPLLSTINTKLLTQNFEHYHSLIWANPSSLTRKFTSLPRLNRSSIEYVSFST